GTVRIRVAAATVNPSDVVLRAGARAAILKDHPPPYVAGLELAGTVDAVGPGVEDWRVGDRVAAIVTAYPTGRGPQSALVVTAGCSPPCGPSAARPSGASASSPSSSSTTSTRAPAWSTCSGWSRRGA